MISQHDMNTVPDKKKLAAKEHPHAQEENAATPQPPKEEPASAKPKALPDQFEIQRRLFFGRQGLR
jgi:hypothetical protein